MIEVKDLSFAYDETQVLKDISFKAEKGTLTALLGTNGAGKSTLFRCLLGLLPRFKGSVSYDGRPLSSISRKELSRYVAYIPQTESPIYSYSVFESVLMGVTGTLNPLRAPGPEHEKAAEEALRELGILHLRDKGIKEISGGEWQLVLLARAIVQKAGVLIMDEPTANLDYGNQQYVLGLMQKLSANGYTVIFSTHNPEHALRYATHVLAIKDHRVIADGTVSVLDEQLIRDIYGMKVMLTKVTTDDGQVIRSCIPV